MCNTVRHSSRSVSAGEDSRQTSSEPSSSSEEEESSEEEVDLDPKTPTTSRVLPAGWVPHGPNHGIAESSIQLDSGSVRSGPCDVTDDCDCLVTHDK